VADYLLLVDDLEAEEANLDALVAPLDETRWRAPTPATGWDIRDSIAHLGWSEELANSALHHVGDFERRLSELAGAIDRAGNVMVARGRSMTGADVLAWWRDVRARTITGLRARDAKERIPWIAGPMSAMSFATARLMETWAHGQDVADALAVERAPTERLRHVADLGVRTRRFAYAARGRDLPDGDVRVELEGPGGTRWTWGESTTDVVRGPAIEFCLVTTQRRNPADTRLEVTGALAREWIAIAQAFAGPPTEHRAARGTEAALP